MIPQTVVPALAAIDPLLRTSLTPRFAAADLPPFHTPQTARCSLDSTQSGRRRASRLQTRRSV